MLTGFLGSKEGNLGPESLLVRLLSRREPGPWGAPPLTPVACRGPIECPQNVPFCLN